MRQAEIPTGQQPISQSRNASGREYRYEVPQAGGLGISHGATANDGREAYGGAELGSGQGEDRPFKRRNAHERLR